jgi:hypothetical protein
MEGHSILRGRDQYQSRPMHCCNQKTPRELRR